MEELKACSSPSPSSPPTQQHAAADADAPLHDISLLDSSSPSSSPSPTPPPTNNNNYTHTHPRIMAVQYNGHTLHTAATKGDLPLVVMLWGMARSQQQDPMRADSEGNTPLHHAALAPTPEVASFIMQQTGGQSLHSPPQALTHTRNAHGEIPLLRAAATGHVSVLQYLLAQGSALDAIDSGNGNSVLHNLCRNGHLWGLHFVVRMARETCFREEHEMRKFVSMPDSEGHTCLDWACFNGHVHVVQYLLTGGAGAAGGASLMDATTHTDAKGRNGLHLAARNRHVDVCRYLVGKVGLSPYAKDLDGKDAFAHASEDYATIQALKEHEGKSHQKKGNSNTASIICCHSTHTQHAMDNTPTRSSPVRVSFLLTYALLSAFLWTLPFFLPWYIVLPFTLLLTISYKRLSCLQRQRQYTTTHIKSRATTTWVSTFFLAHERHVGFWCGTLLAFALTLPLLSQWPRSALWTSTHTHTELLAAPSGTADGVIDLSSSLVVAMYVSFALCLWVWWSLVFARPDPGVVPFNETHYYDMLDQVMVTLNPPSSIVCCHTCMLRKPLRSKHCRECGYCVAKMDHHCVWLDTCVGVQNHGRFLLFVFLHLLSVTLFSASILHVLLPLFTYTHTHTHFHDAGQFFHLLLLRPLFPLLLQGLFALGTLCGLSALLHEQTRNVLNNMTSNERINGERYMWINTHTRTGGRAQNAFSRGSRWGNLLEFVAVSCMSVCASEGGEKKEKSKYWRDYRSVYEVPMRAMEERESMPVRVCDRRGCCQQEEMNGKGKRQGELEEEGKEESVEQQQYPTAVGGSTSEEVV